eukprot:GGOE01048042.1.p1 GENE.GGOE01048042.1~~GGOE01048042.1.p1  ORF type:complete len:187 (-),score=11.33 GGOE01048042.1:1916-2476(-)
MQENARLLKDVLLHTEKKNCNRRKGVLGRFLCHQHMHHHRMHHLSALLLQLMLHQLVLLLHHRSVDGQICTKPPYVHIFRTVEPAPSMRGAPLPMVRQSCNQQVQSLQVKSLNIQVTTPHNRFSSLCPLLLSRLFQCQTSKYRTHTLVRSPISHSHLHTSQAWDTVEDGWGLCGLGLLCHSALVLG